MKRFVLNQEQHGKLFLIGATLLIWSLIIISFNARGYRETWELWKVPTARHVFLDFQLIPGSAESFRQGFEPTIENPYDPAGRIFNYPAFWRLFFYTGITSADTIWIGIAMNVLFCIGVFLFPKKLTISAAIGMLFVIFSPAAMLLYERGNVDLIVFFLCVLIILAEHYSSYVTVLLIAFGAVVKLFPFFGVSVLLKEAKNRFWMSLMACSLFLAVYLISTSNSVQTAWNRTMRGDEISYGTDIFVTRYDMTVSKVLGRWIPGTQVNMLVDHGSRLAGFVLLVLVVGLGIQNSQQTDEIVERNLTAFRMGAAIYVGTFMLGNNFDYRLTFLVLVVPQLMEWMRSTDRKFNFLSRACLGAVYLSCWHFLAWYAPYFDSSHERLKALFIFDEIINWLLMAGLAYLLAASTPAWLKEQAASILPKRRIVPLTP